MNVYEYIEAFKAGPQWAEMQETVEDSPWHREANVAVHTQMVMDQYITRFAPYRSDAANRIALIALLFHDIGKPDAEEELPREDGTLYRRYAGHEPLSANGFIQAYMTDKNLQDLLSVKQAAAVRWIIEHHLPYAYKDSYKRRALKTATIEFLSEAGDIELQTFYDCLRSDAAGRISDDHAQKLANVEEWIEGFDKLLTIDQPFVDKKVMYVLIGASGAGKSTFTNNLDNVSAVVGFDDLKVEMFRRDIVGLQDIPEKELYERAWQYCTLGEGAKAFDKWSKEVLMKRIKDAATKDDAVVVVDTVNSTKKRRAFFTGLGRQHKFEIRAIEFWVSLETLMARQAVRPEKSVPRKSVQSQLSAMSAAWLGSEVDRYEVFFQGDENV